MKEIHRALITDSIDTCRFGGYKGRKFIVSGGESAEDEISMIMDIFNDLIPLASSADIRTTHVKMNNVRLTGAYISVSLKTVYPWEIEKKKMEIMQGFQLAEQEQAKPWWRFW